MSSYSAESDENEEFCCEDLFDDRVDDLIHPMLQGDIDLFKQHCQLEQITCKILNELHEVDIEMTMNLGFMKHSVLAAWGLCHELPLILKVNANFGDYTQDKGSSKVDVFQDKKSKQNCIMIQLKNIGKAYCQQYVIQCASGEGSNKLINSVQAVDERNESVKKDDSVEKGFLVELHLYMCQRLQTLNDYCQVCDKLHGATAMLKPTVCCNPLCIFSSQTLGVMFQVTDTLHTQPEVVDLLIAFTRAAVLSSRHDLVLKPFPSVMDFDSMDFLFSQDGDGHKLLRKIITSLSSIQLSSVCSEAELRHMMSSYHKQCYPLLRWIISSNRSHILYLPKGKQFEMVETSHQYLMRNSPPSEDTRFKDLAKKFGSSYAFHGSPLENWHSIIRQGLIVASGTELQLNGAAAGKGIYVTPDLSKALSYTRGRVVDNRGQNFCVALCEVITVPHMKKGKSIWLISDSQFIRPRFFFLYPSRAIGHNVLSTSCEFVECIRKILSNT